MYHNGFDVPFAKSIYSDRYQHPEDVNWTGTTRRVVGQTTGALYTAPRAQSHVNDILDLQDRLCDLVGHRKFCPGGRYLYGAGRDLHQVNNCLLMRGTDSREGWAEMASNTFLSLMTGAGIGVWYGDLRAAGAPISRTGGQSGGPLSLANAVNDIGRRVLAGGNRRGAIWAGVPWWHADVFDFITCKDWPEEIKRMKAEYVEGQREEDFPAEMDTTNISVTLDDDFFECFFDDLAEAHNEPYAPDGGSWHAWATRVYYTACEHMTLHGEPGFTVDTGHNREEVLRNAPVTAGTHVLTTEGYKPVAELINVPHNVWTGKQWASATFKLTQREAPILSVEMTGGRVIRCEPTHEFLVERYHGAGPRRTLKGIERIKAEDLQVGDQLHVSLAKTTHSYFESGAYTLGYLYGDGPFHKSGGADLTLCTDESKACLPYLSGYRTKTDNDSRGYTRLYFSVEDRWAGRSKDAFPRLAGGKDELPSFLAGLFDADGNYEPTQKRIRLAGKYEGFLRGVARGLEELGILSHVSKAGTSTYGKAQGYQLVIAAEYNSLFAEIIPTKRIRPEPHTPYRASCVKVTDVSEDGFEDVYCADVGVEEHSFQAEGVIISNCTEITSADDSDVCNLGSLVLPRFKDLREWEAGVQDAVMFLTAGSLYSDTPYEKVNQVRDKNRRLGLGIMGVHEFLLKRGLKYGSDEACEALLPYMEIYERALEYARDGQDMLGISPSVAATAIAPNGTIGALMETTPGSDPLFSAAEIRRVKTSRGHTDTFVDHVVVDPTAARLVREGVDPDSIEDAYQLALVPQRRFKQQAFLQEFVDHAISGTVNIPAPLTDHQDARDFADDMMRYLPKLRGITVYPDGARAGQPRKTCDLAWALDNEGTAFESNLETCAGGVCAA